MPSHNTFMKACTLQPAPLPIMYLDRQTSNALSRGESAVLEPGDAFRFCRGFEGIIRVSAPARAEARPQEEESAGGCEDRPHTEENISTSTSRGTGGGGAVGVADVDVQSLEKLESVMVELEAKPGNRTSVVDSAKVIGADMGQPISEDATPTDTASPSRPKQILASDVGQDLEKNSKCSGSVMATEEGVAAAGTQGKERLSADGDNGLAAHGDTKVKQEAYEDDQGQSKQQSGNDAAAATNMTASSSRSMASSHLLETKRATSVDGGASVRHTPDEDFESDGTPAKRARTLHTEDDVSAKSGGECEAGSPAPQSPFETALSAQDWLSTMDMAIGGSTEIPSEVSLHPHGACQEIEPNTVQPPNTPTVS